MSQIPDQRPADPRDQRVCWFCGVVLVGGRGGNAAREHVIAQWLQAELGLDDVEITPTWHAEPLGELLDQRRQTWGTLLVGRICAPCNNGWMSDLEIQAQPILTPLVRGERELASLTDGERFTVARWAVKTVYTLSAAVQEKRVPITHYHELRDSPAELPAGVYVFASKEQDLSAPAHYTVDATWKMSRKVEKEDEAAAVARSSYKAYLQLGKLVLLVVWWPLGPEWILSFEEDLYVRLWPRTADVLAHPAPDPLPAEIQAIAGPELMHELAHNSGAVGLRYTQSVNAFHRGDLPDWLLETFGIKALP